MSVFKLEVVDHVAEVTVDNPPYNNFSVFEDISSIFTQLDRREDIRAILLTGNGDRYFCTGVADASSAEGVNGMATTSAENGGRSDYRFHHWPSISESILNCGLPIVGAINGLALGGGLALAACCDFLVASENAEFGVPEVTLGYLGGGAHFLRLFPAPWARYALITGKRITAQDAYNAGAVIKVVPLTELMDAAREIAQWIAAQAPVATRLAKRSMDMIERGNLNVREGYRWESTQTQMLQTFEDAGEARRAWLEKRPGTYHNR